MGRRFKPELKSVISVYLPVDLILAINEVTDNRSEFIEDILRDSMSLVAVEKLELRLETLQLEKKKVESEIARIEGLIKSLKEKPSKKLEEALGEIPEK